MIRFFVCFGEVRIENITSGAGIRNSKPADVKESDETRREGYFFVVFKDRLNVRRLPATKKATTTTTFEKIVQGLPITKYL